MEIHDLVYHRPQSLGAAIQLGEDLGRDGCFLAGGTEILANLKQKREGACHIIALSGLQELAEIRSDETFLRIGAMVRLGEIASSGMVAKYLPALAEAVRTMAAAPIRNIATMGGNFCGAVPSADTPPISIAAGALLRLVGPGGQRVMAAEEFFLSPRRTVLKRGELLIEILIPHQPAGAGSCYQRFALRGATALAVAAVAVRLIIQEERIVEARVVLGAVAPRPLLALETGKLLAGRVYTELLFDDAARQAADEARPIDDLRGSVSFRRDLVEALTRRALREAARRGRVTEQERGAP